MFLYKARHASLRLHVMGGLRLPVCMAKQAVESPQVLASVLISVIGLDLYNVCCDYHH